MGMYLTQSPQRTERSPWALKSASLAEMDSFYLGQTLASVRSQAPGIQRFQYVNQVLYEMYTFY